MSAGDVTSDALNQYVYDAEGRVCAVEQSVAGVVKLYRAGGPGLK